MSNKKEDVSKPLFLYNPASGITNASRENAYNRVSKNTPLKTINKNNGSVEVILQNLEASRQEPFTILKGMTVMDLKQYIYNVTPKLVECELYRIRIGFTPPYENHISESDRKVVILENNKDPLSSYGIKNGQVMVVAAGYSDFGNELMTIRTPRTPIIIATIEFTISGATVDMCVSLDGEYIYAIRYINGNYTNRTAYVGYKLFEQGYLDIIRISDGVYVRTISLGLHEMPTCICQSRENPNIVYVGYAFPVQPLPRDHLMEKKSRIISIDLSTERIVQYTNRFEQYDTIHGIATALMPEQNDRMVDYLYVTHTTLVRIYKIKNDSLELVGQYGTLIDPQQMIQMAVNTRRTIQYELNAFVYRSPRELRPYQVPADNLLNDELNCTIGICIHGDKIYVADTMNNRIIVLTTDLQYVGQINNSTLKPNTTTLFRPTRICVSNNNELFVLCKYNVNSDKKDYIVVIDITIQNNASIGKYLREFTPNNVLQSYSICISNTNALFVGSLLINPYNIRRRDTEIGFAVELHYGYIDGFDHQHGHAIYAIKIYEGSYNGIQGGRRYNRKRYNSKRYKGQTYRNKRGNMKKRYTKRRR